MQRTCDHGIPLGDETERLRYARDLARVIGEDVMHHAMSVVDVARMVSTTTDLPSYQDGDGRFYLRHEVTVWALRHWVPSPPPKRMHALKRRGKTRIVRVAPGVDPHSVSPSWVYFLRAGTDGAIKIGVTETIEARMAQLQTGSAERLHLLAIMRGDEKIERQLHARFAGHRMMGEWFRAVPELLEFVASIPVVDSTTIKIKGANGYE